ncbi:ABC transporter permease subunit [Longispora albida]|uniref:ABC transporter permease subunit n=1 Tax=Longispora albida TaxID=203523 RepID=UPI0003720353|nr:ABC transporter permease subunit [Longispora albida]
MNLFKAEVSRLASRRFIQIVVVLLVLLLGVIWAGLFFSHQKITPEVRQNAETRATQEWDRLKADCESGRLFGGPDMPGKPRPEVPSGMTGEECLQQIGMQKPKAEWFMPSTFDFKDYVQPMVIIFGVLLCLFAFLAGATFVGAEWSSGGMMNLLLWRPRRIPVLLTKALALMAAVTAVFAALGAVWTLLLYLTAKLRGHFDGVTGGVVQSAGLTGLRALLLVLGASLLGFAVASLGRRTAAALGAALGLALIGEVGARIVLTLLRVTFVEKWLLSSYVTAWLEKKSTFESYEHCATSNTVGECKPLTLELTMNHSALVLGVVLALTVGGAMYAFQKRDVT